MNSRREIFYPTWLLLRPAASAIHPRDVSSSMESSDDDESYAGSAESIAAERERGDAQVVTAIQTAFDPLPLDRAIVVEAQRSGLLNSVAHDMQRLNAEAEELCARMPAQLAKMQSLVKKTEANLTWLQNRTEALAKKKKSTDPIEYMQAESRIMYGEDP